MTESLWLTSGPPPWPDLRDLDCVVCGQPYKVSPAYKPGYYSRWYQITWPYRKTVTWSVRLFGSSAGYALCGCCSPGGTGRTHAYTSSQAPDKPQRLVYHDRVFWETADTFWHFRNFGTWAGSRSRCHAN